MGDRASANMRLMLIAALCIACITCSQVDAIDVDTVVPQSEHHVQSFFDQLPQAQASETNQAAPSLELLSQGAVTAFQKAQVAQVKHLAQSAMMLVAPPTDGGTDALAKRVTTAKQTIGAAIKTMADNVDTDYTAGTRDLTTLKNTIKTAVQEVSKLQKDQLRTNANAWCTAKRAEEAAVTAHSDAQTARDDYNPVIESALAQYKKLGSITSCDRNSQLNGGQCPDPTVVLDPTIMLKFKAARTSYYDKDKVLQASETTKTTKEAASSTMKTTLRTGISTLVADFVNFCKADGDVYNSAVDEFNNNNDRRALMLRTLREVKCTIDHMDNTQSNEISVDDPKSGSSGKASTANACQLALKSAATLKSEKFGAATKQAFTCPSEATYVGKVKAVYGMQLTLAWTPTTSNCQKIPTPPRYKWNKSPSTIGQPGGHWAGADSCQCNKPGASAGQNTAYAAYNMIGIPVGGRIADCSSNHLNNCCYNELGASPTYEKLNQACAAKCDSWDGCFGYYVGTKASPAMRGVPGIRPNIDAPDTCSQAFAACTVYYTQGTWASRPSSWTLSPQNGYAAGWMTYNHNGVQPRNTPAWMCGNLYGCERKIT